MTRNPFWKKVLVHAGALISVLIVCLALWVLFHTVQTISLQDIIAHVKKLSIITILSAFLITACSYFIVTGYDVIALRHINRPLPYSRAALSAFLASTFGNNIGFAIVTGTSIRYRIYSQVGLSALEIAGISGMCALTTFLGMIFVFSISMILQNSGMAQHSLPLSPGSLQLIGAVFLTAIMGYVVYTTIRPITIHTESWSLRLPSAKTTLSQIALATANLFSVASLIYVLLPAETDTGYFSFLAVFALAIIAGSASNVPGGIGVFESVLLLGLPQIPPAALLGSILLFRCIYYLTPLIIAATMLAFHESQRQKEAIEGVHERTTDWLADIGPYIMSYIVVLAGAILLFTNAIPHFQPKFTSSTFVPLIFVELGHLTAGAVGVCLILLAHSISQRLDIAYRLTVVLVLIGIVACLLRAFDFQEAIILSLLYLLINYTRPEFNRKASLFDLGYPAEWISLFSVVLALTIWIGLFSFKHVEYSGDLWWHIGYQSEYSRFLRSIVVMAIISGAVTIFNLARPDVEPELLRRERLGKILNILGNQTDIRGNWVLLADKRILFNDDETAFIMYRVRGKNWIAFSDPIGPQSEHLDLLWKFLALSDRYSGQPAFFQVDEANKSNYTELGLSLIHLGDDALVPLDDFSAIDDSWQDLIDIHERVESEGLSFAVVSENQVADIMLEMQKVSEAWLENTGSVELGFSKGHFDPNYLVYFSAATVRKNNELIGFANLFICANQSEFSVDILRYTNEIPKGFMDYLYWELMLWGKSQGCKWFNLGLAPLVDLKGHPLEPLWNRIGKYLFRQGEHFKNFENLRHFEERFHPIWRPKYLALADSLHTAKVFLDTAKLILPKNEKI